MRFSAIVAMNYHGVIGHQGKLLWHHPEDMRFFRETTTGHPVLMGRKTWESLPSPLKDRQNIILTRQTDYKADGAIVIHSLDELETIPLINDEVFVIGGAEIYKLTGHLWETLYITKVRNNADGDTHWPWHGGHPLEIGHKTEHLIKTNDLTITRYGKESRTQNL